LISDASRCEQTPADASICPRNPNPNPNPNRESESESNGAHDIIEYLNQKAGTAYKHTSQKTKDLIQARINEKFTLEDFYKVIDNKVDEWLNTEWQKFLRPETLFSNKFEGYLNQKPKPQQQQQETMSEGMRRSMEIAEKLKAEGVKFDDE
jgi:uncharacterized phage protein (TIGR02220 family)